MPRQFGLQQTSAAVRSAPASSSGSPDLTTSNNLSQNVVQLAGILRPAWNCHPRLLAGAARLAESPLLAPEDAGDRKQQRQCARHAGTASMAFVRNAGRTRGRPLAKGPKQTKAPSGERGFQSGDVGAWGTTHVK